MHPDNRKKLDDRVIRAAEAALAAQKYVSPVDVLVGIGWLDPGALARWQRGQVAYLEEVVQTNLPRISEAMKLFRSWATAKELSPSETHYVARTPSRLVLISLDDALLEFEQVNLPGTFDEYPNWRLPLPETLEELRADPRVAEITAAFRVSVTE